MPPLAQGHRATSHLGLVCIAAWKRKNVCLYVCVGKSGRHRVTMWKWGNAISTMCACVFIYISFSTGAKLTLCYVTHFPHCNSLLISNYSRSFGEGGVQHRKQARKLALRRKDNPEVKVEVRCRFWWLKVLITVINRLIYTA